MNPPVLYGQNGRSIFWIAFVSALAIHLGAVALAKTKSPTAKLEDFSPPGDVELVVTAEKKPALLEESAVPSPLEHIRPDQDNFQEENVTPPLVRAHRNARPAALVRGTTTASLRSVKSDGDVCAAPDLSVRSAPSTPDWIWRCVAYRRSNLGDCD